MDLTESIAPKSDQLNADDLMAGPVTVTIREVTKGTPEQPVDVQLVEFPGRAYRPSKSMRRVMVTAWGAEASAYSGHRLTLVRNPEITFGRDKVGGIEIAAMSHIEKPLTVALTATRGKRKNFSVAVLAAATPTRDWPAELLLAADNIDAVAALGAAATKAQAAREVITAIRGKWAELNAAGKTDEGAEGGGGE
jgi:hypothetical protein